MTDQIDDQDRHVRMWEHAKTWIKKNRKDWRVIAVGGVEDTISHAFLITGELAESYDESKSSERTYVFNYFPRRLEKIIKPDLSHDDVDPDFTPAFTEPDGDGDTVEAFFATLTPRQRDVVLALHAGETEKEIADKLGVKQQSINETRAVLKKKIARFLQVHEFAPRRDVAAMLADVLKANENRKFDDKNNEPATLDETLPHGKEKQ